MWPARLERNRSNASPFTDTSYFYCHWDSIENIEHPYINTLQNINITLQGIKRWQSATLRSHFNALYVIFGSWSSFKIMSWCEMYNIDQLLTSSNHFSRVRQCFCDTLCRLIGLTLDLCFSARGSATITSSYSSHTSYKCQKSCYSRSHPSIQ